MWVRLTKGGYRAVLHAVANDQPMYDAFTRRVVRVKSRVDVEAPYVAWRNVQMLLHQRTFGPLGGRRRYADRDFVALRAITREINYIDTHPALKGIGMLEWQRVVIPAWRILPDSRGRLYSPYPQPQPRGEFVILTPRWGVTAKPSASKYTTWTPEQSGVGEMCDEATHLRLWRGGTT